jgi:hypothetical protein
MDIREHNVRYDVFPRIFIFKFLSAQSELKTFPNRFNLA